MTSQGGKLKQFLDMQERSNIQGLLVAGPHGSSLHIGSMEIEEREPGSNLVLLLLSSEVRLDTQIVLSMVNKLGGQGGFHKSDMQGHGREARLFTQGGLMGSTESMEDHGDFHT